MIIEVEMDRMGCLTLTPVNDRIRRRFARHLRAVYSPHADGTAFLQSDWDVEAFLTDHLRPAQARDVRRGWTVRVRIDPWLYGHYLGWDAHTVVEGGSRYA